MHLSQNVRVVHLHDSREKIIYADHSLAKEVSDEGVVFGGGADRLDSRDREKGSWRGLLREKGKRQRPKEDAGIVRGGFGPPEVFVVNCVPQQLAKLELVSQGDSRGLEDLCGLLNCWEGANKRLVACVPDVEMKCKVGWHHVKHKLYEE